MEHPFTRFDFKFEELKVAAEYEDIDGILYFIFRINDQTEFSVRLVQSELEFFIEIDRLHYGEKLISDRKPTSRLKGSGFPAACIVQIMRKHPELRFVIRSTVANEFALEFARKLAVANALFFVF